MLDYHNWGFERVRIRVFFQSHLVLIKKRIKILVIHRLLSEKKSIHRKNALSEKSDFYSRIYYASFIVARTSNCHLFSVGV
jgi:hypothetical protein